MSHQTAPRASLFALALLLITPACGTHPPQHPKLPAPTEHRLSDAAESLQKSARKKYIRDLHRAPPGLDWQQIERLNGVAQMEQRNQLSAFAAGASRWTERGSDNVAGRMHVTVPAPDGQSLYAGSSRGGVWHGGLDGSNWTPLADGVYGGAHWLSVLPGDLPSDPDILVAANDGGLIHRSTDGGVTWTWPSGLPAEDKTTEVRRVITTTGGSIFMVVRWWKPTNPPFTGESLVYSVFRSQDKGATFTQAIGMGTYWGDLWTPRTGTGPVYMLKQSDLYASPDDGETWNVVGSLPNDSDGGELAGSEAGAPRFYAIVGEGGTRKLYRSDDAGASWTYKLDVSDYWGTLSASITDADLFAWGGVEVHRSTDGGNNFGIVNAWWEYYGQEATKLHADVPGLDVVPNGGGEIWYVSTDGGLFRSTDGLASVENLSLDGLRVSQYYDVHTSTANVEHVLAGAQDQGYQRSDTAPGGGGTTKSFEQLISGDYAHLTSGDGTHAWVYSVYPGFILIHKGENNPTLYQEDFPAGESYPWLPVVVADPYANTRWFFCGEKLWRYKKIDFINSWTKVEWSTQDFGVSSGEFLTGLAFSPVDPERAYAASNQGRLWVSDDHGLTWSQGATTGPGSGWLHGTAVVASALDVDTSYVGGSGYGSPAVWRSTNGGATYDPWGQGLPDTLVYGMAEAPDGVLYAGTETAAYKRAPGDSEWTDITGADAPITTYWSVESVAALGAMRFGTYGRGIWDYDTAEACVYEPTGVGAGGANVMTLDTASATTIGQVHTLTAAGGPALATGSLLFSLAPASLPFKAGTLLVDPATLFLIGIQLDAAGALTLPLPIPADALLEGLGSNFQLIVADGGQPKGWALSNGLSGTFCGP